MPPAFSAALRFHGTSTHYSEAADPVQRRALLAWADGVRRSGLAQADSIAFAAQDAFLTASTLCDVVGVGCDFRYRAFDGTDDARNSACELDALALPAFRQVVRRQYLETVRARQALLHIVYAETPAGVFSYTRLSVPLSVHTAEVGRLWLVPAGFGRFVDRLHTSAAQAA